MTEPRDLGSAALVRLVAGREMSSRLRDKNFIISSIVIILLLVGSLALQVALNAGEGETRVGVVGEAAELGPALEAQGEALDVEVTVTELDDEAAGRRAIEDGDVDGVVVPGDGTPQLLVEQSAGSPLQAVVQGAVAQLSVTEQLAAAGLPSLEVPEVRSPRSTPTPTPTGSGWSPPSSASACSTACSSCLASSSPRAWSRRRRAGSSSCCSPP